jgi:hypothetical protein
MNNTKYSEKRVLLLGEGIHQHTIYGRIENDNRFSENDIILDEDGVLVHEKPDGSKGEHHTLLVEKGRWILGRQVEFDPFSGFVTGVWD